MLRIVDFENNTVHLTGDIRIKTTRFQGRLLTEVCPSTFEQIRELRGMGLVNIVQNGKQRFFLPELSPHIYLEPVLALYPPISTDIDFLPELKPEFQALKKKAPISLPQWLSVPDPRDVSELQIFEETLFLS